MHFKKYNQFILIAVLASALFSSCQSKTTQPEQTPTPVLATPTAVWDITGGAGKTSNSGGQQAVCFREELPPAYESSTAVQGIKTFTTSANIKLRYIYFPISCSQENIEKDVRLLFFSDFIKDNELALLMLEPVQDGSLGKLYAHLAKYNFWAMGPEDYPMLLERRAKSEKNILIFRVDRMNGEGDEGNNLLELTIRMGEHEYIHTVQGHNNPDLAEMIWTDPVYRYYIENYSNIYNNFGKMYYESSYTLLMLIQFLDSLHSKGTLEAKTVAILKEKGMNLDTFLKRDVHIYNQHIRAHVEQVGGKPYLERVTAGRVSPMTLVEMAGSGDVEAYEVIRRLYDLNIGEYDQKFYGPNKEKYMPSFDTLFKLE